MMYMRWGYVALVREYGDVTLQGYCQSLPEVQTGQKYNMYQKAVSDCHVRTNLYRFSLVIDRPCRTYTSYCPSKSHAIAMQTSRKYLVGASAALLLVGLVDLVLLSACEDRIYVFGSTMVHPA